LAIDVDHTCPYVVVYDQQAHAVCVEPQTAPPDAAAVVGDACRVVPGAPLVARTAWRWRSLAG
jgi:aldose 1-epimerase